MDRLIVKNFGPLKDIDIELNKINLFIGENGSGKSVLAKLIIIILNIVELKNIKSFKDKLKKFNLSLDYLSENSFIKFSSENNIIVITETTINIKGKTFNELIKSINEAQNVGEQLKLTLNNKKLKNQITETLEKLHSSYNGIIKYLPAERNFISIFNKSLSSMIVANIPIPKFILEFASEYEKARDEIKELNFLNVRYENSDRDRIYYDKENYLPLEHSSSGIQSAIPMLLTAKYFAKNFCGLIIEEPEQNLFPKAQDEVVKFIIEQVNSEDSNLFLMTHSPYVLSTLNNLIFAHKVSNLNNKAKEQVEELIKEGQWINPDSFSAYYLKDGVAKSIVSKRGLISDNIIDDVSDEVESEFNTLMEIYREVKNAK